VPPTTGPAPESSPPPHAAPHAPGTDAPERFTVELLERGGSLRGELQALDTRLFIQLQCFTGCGDSAAVVEAVRSSGLEAVVYANLNDPRGVGVLLFAEDPETFAGAGRALYLRPPFPALTPEPGFTMIGRTYATGREPNLEDWLLRKPRRNALDPANRWAVWYPLRRLGAFNRLQRAEQGKIMAEHATIGRAYGEIGEAFDIRLECHGLDRLDNEFVLGIVGPRLFSLSKLIKDMRATRQTSEFIQTMGPFFIGRTLYQSPLVAG
jgi:chlorite dismutase